MHYFIDYSQLPPQNTSDGFGPDSSDSTNKYKITSQFQLTAQAKAFACQDGLMIVQQSLVNSSLVNIILKPSKGLKIPFNSVKYYIYRGLLKDSFINGTVIKPKTQALDNSFIKRFWNDVELFKTNTDQPNLPDPDPRVFGYNNTLSNTLDIEKIYDNSQPSTNAIYVKEGEWIGDFGFAQKIGFEVIIETDSFSVYDFNYMFDLNYLKQGQQAVDVSGLTGFDKRAKQELILSYIDPCAFFGLHYDVGVDISIFNGNVKTVEKKKQNELYTLLLEKFATSNRVYLDIRSEKGYSYNLYQNYRNSSNKNIKVGNSDTVPIEQIYEANNWPIIFVDTAITTSSDKNNIKINLRIDDNLKPILFFENNNLIGKENNSCFIDETKILNESATDWSNDLNFYFPNIGAGTSKNNVGYYIKLYYFRQEYNLASPNTVLKNENYFNTAFCPIDLPNLADSGYLFQHSINSDFNYTKGLLPNINSEFSYVAESGAQWDANRMVFYNKAVFKNKKTDHFFKSNVNFYSNPGFNLQGDFNKMSFLSKEILLNKTTIQEVISSGVYQEIKILNIIQNNSSNAYEDLICVGITQVEFSTLKSITGFTTKHHRYIYIQEINDSPFDDKDDKLFRKFELKIQGLDNTGNRLIAAPTTPIYIYTQNGLVFASREFASLETIQQTETYQRNYEENIGYLNKKPNTTKNYEDYFIEDINPNMKIVVDSFINTLGNIANDENTYHNIKMVVEDNARDIWNEAVNFVQENVNTTPDDRPLYWARIKMQTALKNHPYFIGQFTGSEVNLGSDLEQIVKIFEEKSRNYTGLDFSAAPAGAKKILITGFDPFQLDRNKEQQNPSGIVALALHGKTLIDSSGNKGFIQVAIFPVRYFDFDNEVVENLVRSYLQNNSVNMIMTLSLNGGAYYFDLERFAGKKRSGSSDNLNISAASIGFKQIQNIEQGNEFYQTTLPIANIITNQITNNFDLASQRFFYDQSYKASNEREHVTKDSLQPNSNVNSFSFMEISGKSDTGSGGSYLSNEIFYRVARLRDSLSSIVKTGHFHLANSSPSAIPNGINQFNVIEIINESKNAIIRTINSI